MRHIADKAKLIAKNSRNSHKFQGSIGWVRHFLRRYPKMRKLYDKSRAQAKPNYPNSYY